MGEELGITQANAHPLTSDTHPPVPQLHGQCCGTDKRPGLDPRWGMQVTGALGNYGEIFDRDLEAHSRLRLDREENWLRASGVQGDEPHSTVRDSDTNSQAGVSADVARWERRNARLGAGRVTGFGYNGCRLWRGAQPELRLGGGSVGGVACEHRFSVLRNDFLGDNVRHLGRFKRKLHIEFRNHDRYGLQPDIYADIAGFDARAPALGRSLSRSSDLRPYCR